MIRNTAGQNCAVQMNSRTDGAPLTADVAVAVTKDNGTSTAGSGTLTHKANGHWNYTPTQAETDAAHVVFQFTHATGVNQVVQAYPVDPSFVRSTRSIVRGTADTGATTTSIPTSTLDPAAAVADQFKGRIVLFDRDTTTAALRGQGTDITASTAGGTLTVSQLTTAPASGDTFVIV